MSEQSMNLHQESQKTTHQHRLADLQRGSPGGRAIVRQYGVEHMRQLAAAGGRATVRQYGVEHMRQLAAAGGRERKRRAYTWPRTVRTWYGTVERRIPLWPSRATSRRKRPIFVYIEVQA